MNKFIVLDVEGMSGKKPYNVGFIVADKHGKIYKRYSFAMPENISATIEQVGKTQQAIEMTARNVQEILSDFSNSVFKRKYKCVSNSYIMNFLVKVIKKFKIRKIYAYNAPFDKTAIKNLFSERFKELEEMEIEFIDIIPLILKTKLLTKKYCNFCIENGFITEKGNIQTKAEVVYKYLTNNIDFEEEHTGLSDVLIEYEILLEAFKTKKKLDSTPCSAWKMLADFCRTNGISVAPNGGAI